MKFRDDPIPRVPPGGYKGPGADVSAAMCIMPDAFGFGGEDDYAQPSTPDRLKKYRKSHTGQPGFRTVHPGLVEDAENLDRNAAYGKATNNSMRVGTVMEAQNLNGLADKFHGLKEAKYASKIREPLAASYQRGYAWPEAVPEPKTYNFGVPSISQISAKELIYPAGGSLEERNDVKAMYTKTHGSIQAGAQKNRNYDWPMNPVNHSFGYGEIHNPGGAYRATNPERQNGIFPKTVIVKKTVEDHRAVAGDMLG